MKILSLLLIASSLIVAGCGSGDSSSASGAGPTTAPPKMDDPRMNPSSPDAAPAKP